LWTALIWVLKVTSYDPPERLLFVGPITHFVHRYVNWFVADFLVTLIAVGSMGLLWRVYGPLNVGWVACVTAALAIALLFSVTGAVLGVNRIDWAKAAPQDVYDLLGAWAIAALLAFAANLLAGVLPSGLVIMASLLSLFGFIAVRYRERLATGLVSYILRHRAAARGNLERVLIVGSHENAQYVAWLLRQPGNAQRFQVYGFVDDDLFAQGMRVHGASVVGTHNDIPKLVAEHNIKVIILADPRLSQDQQDSIAEVCGVANIRFVLLPDMVDSLGDLCGGASSTGEAGSQASTRADSDLSETMAGRSSTQVAHQL
jgi:FlaA1/EpsC-like NDP-sugar epimerase